MKNLWKLYSSTFYQEKIDPEFWSWWDHGDSAVSTFPKVPLKTK